MIRLIRNIGVKFLCLIGVGLDIHSKGYWPEDELSNFYPHSFVFDGVECASMEGFLQSLKYKDINKQCEICALTGRDAKDRGSGTWVFNQDLYWKGKQYNRHGIDYLRLVRNAYDAMYSQCEDFRKALKAVGNKRLFHTIGKTNPHDTVLTEGEFIQMLDLMRDRLKLEEQNKALNDS